MSAFRIVGITGNLAGCATAIGHHWTALAWLFGVAGALSVIAEIVEQRQRKPSKRSETHG